MKQYRVIATAALLGALAVAAGAFGAHTLKVRLEATDLANFETAVRYQMVHALVLLILGSLWEKLPHRLAAWSFHLMWLGILCFSGSLYLLSTRSITGLVIKWIWPVTPLGGIFMIAGWALLAIAAYQANRRNR